MSNSARPPGEDGALEAIIEDIKYHDATHPDHGVGCACMDRFVGELRRLFDQHGLYEKRVFACEFKSAHDELCSDCKQFGTVCRKPGTFSARSKSLNNLITIFGYLQR